MMRNTFTIHSCTRSRLATAYYPDYAPQHAMRLHKADIDAFPGLTARLTAMGYTPGHRRYTPAMVKTIVDAIGEP